MRLQASSSLIFDGEPRAFVVDEPFLGVLAAREDSDARCPGDDMRFFCGVLLASYSSTKSIWLNLRLVSLSLAKASFLLRSMATRIAVDAICDGRY